MHLPPRVLKKATAMSVEIMTFGLPLRPVPNVMSGNHAKGPSHSHEGAEINQKILQPFWRFERLMNQKAMHANGMACADRNG
jgi:hypothetical protein